jgi:hypothetical protein
MRHGFEFWGLFVVLLALSLWSVPAQGDQAPEGWILTGTHPADYSAGTTNAVSQEGRACAYLASIVPQPAEGFGNLMQTIAADAYRGKRIRLAGFAKPEGVEGWAGLWMRIDGPEKPPLGFDNMSDRPIRGTGDWRRCEIVLDVPQEATDIAFGILLAGKGKVYLDNVTFEEVPLTVKVTNVSGMMKKLPSAPVNLNFEK